MRDRERQKERQTEILFDYQQLFEFENKLNPIV